VHRCPTQDQSFYITQGGEWDARERGIVKISKWDHGVRIGAGVDPVIATVSMGHIKKGRGWGLGGVKSKAESISITTVRG